MSCARAAQESWEAEGSKVVSASSEGSRDGGKRTWFVVEREKALCSMSMRIASKPAALATPTISTDVQSLIDMDEKHSSRASAALARLRTVGVAPFFILRG